MNQNILKFCMEKGILLDKEASCLLEELDENTTRRLIEKISGLNEKIITKAFFSRNAEKISEMIDDKSIKEKLKINLGVSLEISRIVEKEERKEEAIERIGNLKVLHSHVNVTRKITPEDFVRYFRVRYSEIKQILQERRELENLTSINKINGSRQGLSIIGLVFSKRQTKNKNFLLEVEDLTGRVAVLINKSKYDLYEKAKDIIPDDIIGIKGFGNGEIIFANDVFYPDIFLHEKAKIDRDESAAFISDIHVGSSYFLEKNFLKFISWINGEEGDEKQKEEARKVRYLFITGDGVDGVGRFPGQEELLTIKDIKNQYAKLAENLARIRKDVKIIFCPGQHDAVWVGQPQPPIIKEYAEDLYQLENVVLVSNPSFIEITNDGNKGIKVLMYHGASMNSYINEIESLRFGKASNNPTKIVKEMLKRRHLASMHSAVDYIPYEADSLIIKEIPDIFITGEMHKVDIDIYNNILIICSSCWQNTTSFEEKVGHMPEPCKVPVLNLRTREIKILDFSEGK